MINVLLAGHPTDNPILSGIAYIEDGADPDTVLVWRDQHLDTPEKFFKAAWEALDWIAPGHVEVSQALGQQAYMAWARCAVEFQEAHWSHWRACDLSEVHRQWLLQVMPT